MAWIVGVWGIGDDVVRRKLWLVPLRDAIHFVVWLASFASNHIHWGGEEYIIRQGRLISTTASELPDPGVASQARR
jgi:hypothetical protein